MRDEVTRPGSADAVGTGRRVALHAPDCVHQPGQPSALADPGSASGTLGPRRARGRPRSARPPDAHRERAADRDRRRGRRNCGRGGRARWSPGWCRSPCPSPMSPHSTAVLFAICLLVTVGTGVLFGVLPSLRLASSASLDGLKDGDANRREPRPPSACDRCSWSPRSPRPCCWSSAPACSCRPSGGCRRWIPASSRPVC